MLFMIPIWRPFNAPTLAAWAFFSGGNIDLEVRQHLPLLGKKEITLFRLI
jgi:hypothetical protein